MIQIEALLNAYKALYEQRAASGNKVLKLFRKHLSELEVSDIDPDGIFFEKLLNRGRESLLELLSRRSFKVEISYETEETEEGREERPLHTEWVWFSKESLQDFIQKPISRSLVKAALSKLRGAYGSFSKHIHTLPLWKPILPHLAEHGDQKSWSYVLDARIQQLYYELN